MVFAFLTILLPSFAALPAHQHQAEPQWIAPVAADAAPRDDMPEPRWIWALGEDGSQPTSENAPAGTVWLCAMFDAPAEGVRSATLALAADNAATVSLNGVEVLRSRDWSSPAFAKLDLKPGANVLAIEARNDHAAPQPGRPAINPAGVCALLRMTLHDGSVRWIATDATWRAASEKWAEFPAAPARDRLASLAPAIDLGPASTAPWRVQRSAFEPSPPCPMLRRSFTLDAAPVRAIARIVGLGHYELRCNGRIVGDSLINQAWSQYDKTIYWQEFDLAPHLRAGENVLALTLGNSFWRVEAPNDHRRFTKTDAMPDFSSGWRHLLWLDSEIETSGSAITRIVSDDQWRWIEGPLIFSHIYAGEDYDARLAQSGWDDVDFDDRGWQRAIIASAPAAALAANPAPPMKAFQRYTPSEIRAIGPGVHTYIFPQNCSALLRFTLTGGKAGSRVRFKPCEYIEPDGRVKFTYTWGTGKDIWHDYIKAGSGRETHQILFCYVGAQFVQVEGAIRPGDANPDNLPVLVSLEMIHVRAACDEVGTFTSSSAMHDAAHRLIDWSLRSNMAHVPTDCPHREKNGWIEQNWHMARAMSYRYDVQAWLSKTCRDMRDAQQPDGHIPTNCPNYLVGIAGGAHGFWNNAPEWGIAGVLVPWHLYEWYGDRTVLDASYDSAKRYIDYLASLAAQRDGMITSNLGDWYDYGHGKGNGPSRWTPNEVSATAIWAYGAQTLVRMAERLGRVEDAQRYRAMHEQIRRDFQRHFYDPGTRTVRNNGSCQAAHAAALCLNLVPDEDRAAVLQAIVDDLERRNWQQTPGEVLQIFLIRALAESGRGDVLHRIYDREEVGSYGYMVRSGLTTLPESWDARQGTGDSLNHFMLGHLMEWHFAYVAGIRQAPGSVGWARIVIAPQPPRTPRSNEDSRNAIRHAEASFQSPRGRIASAWRIENGEITLTCEVPEGVEALAILPDGTQHELKPGANRVIGRAP